ncbi:MAG: ATP-dependent DNA helicase [Bacteroidota bacterium]|nr:ATP-dependent DNA helicase [Bacteroidota bacterium]MDP4217020.1 ATP-dependent DNA helicase [Bacteroidota bacterium]MDP4246192.1 ATP-dependent DNA helicase [Bacteroidota bacterium]MDP4255315.1 ATP-dependent DNA helicase [Bacteroidota bacterium]MDP4258632.1 ATP-dependent DNA helicase [Bacteroidota bacterium]
MSINRERLQEHFREEYNKLNEQQRLAVDTTEGPVMVIAGPGTGKTQILAARIGKILLETDVFPQNILCLTYTDAGAIAMRRRLLSFIGPDAYKVNIHTFHSFCHDLIQENLQLFEKSTLDPISDLERIRYFTQLIDKFPKNHPLKRYRGDVYFEMGNLQQLFSTMKREGWTPDFINARIDEYLADLPNRDGYTAKRATGVYKKGDLRTDKIAEETERMEKLRAAVGEFIPFQELMRSHNRYDFDDMINWVIRAFDENKALLSSYQERYQYILVDEYQDTSGSQNRLIAMLIGYWEQPNVFVVGDDDQSIYRFQGANVENMQGFADTYARDLLKVVLTNNYRSTQPILDVSMTLIDRNAGRLVRQMPGLSKQLVSSHPVTSRYHHPPAIREYRTAREEMTAITLQIESLLAGGTPPGRIAVIYKENKYGEELARYFQLKNMPAFSKRSVDLLRIPFAQKIILLLRYLAAEHDIPYGGDEMLFEILHFDFFGIPPIEIAKLSVEVAERQFSEQRTSLRRLLHERSDRPARDLFDTGLPEGMKRASRALERLIGDVPNVTLQTLFEHCIRHAGILTSIMNSPEKIWLMQVLTALFEFVKEETRRNPDLNLDKLVQMFDQMKANDIPIPVIQVTGSEAAVNLLTAHGSKGLEFETVFLAGCNASVWEKKRKPGGGYKYPDTLFTSPSGTNAETALPPKDRSGDDEELRRLFYVALTRAEQHVFISYARFGEDGKKELEPSMFIAEILDRHALPVERILLDPLAMAEFEALPFSERIAPEIAAAEENFISRMLDKFVMNVTALNNYLKCPLEFYYKNLIRIPSPKNEATEFGSAAHFALQRLFEKMKAHAEEQFPAKEELLQDFQWYMHRHRESFTREAFARRMEYGLDVLGNYYDKYVGRWNKIVAVERNIRQVMVRGVPLKGKLDKLEFQGKEVNVVDYKTGDVEKAREKLRPPDPGEPEDHGGDYWRQAVFYKILVDNYEQKDWKVTSTEFDFIEPDKKKEYQKVKILITPEDIDAVTRQVVDTWKRIQLREFYTGCGRPDCHWCNFVKTNRLEVALHEIAEEE